MASAEHEPILGIWGRGGAPSAPSRVQRQSGNSTTRPRTGDCRTSK